MSLFTRAGVGVTLRLRRGTGEQLLFTRGNTGAQISGIDRRGIGVSGLTTEGCFTGGWQEGPGPGEAVCGGFSVGGLSGGVVSSTVCVWFGLRISCLYESEEKAVVVDSGLEG